MTKVIRAAVYGPLTLGDAQQCLEQSGCDRERIDAVLAAIVHSELPRTAIAA
jgi:hypothetical protein